MPGIIITYYIITTGPPKRRARKELRLIRDPGNGDVTEMLQSLIVHFFWCLSPGTLWGLLSGQDSGGKPRLLVTGRAWVIENRRKGRWAVRWLLSNCSRFSDPSAGPRWERAVSRESLAQGAPVSVSAGCETCLFAFPYSAGAYALAPARMTRPEQDPQPRGRWWPRRRSQ